MGTIGTGTSISFESGFLAEIMDVTPPGAKRDSVNMSHMQTVKAHVFSPTDLIDWGELKCELQFDPSLYPPIDQPESAIVITFPDSTGSTWTFQGFMTGYEPKDPLEDKMVCSCTIKVTGDVTVG